jgi:hypothetical protein
MSLLFIYFTLVDHTKIRKSSVAYAKKDYNIKRMHHAISQEAFLIALNLKNTYFLMHLM